MKSVCLLLLLLAVTNDSWKTDRRPRVFGDKLSRRVLLPSHRAVQRKILVYHNFFRSHVRPPAADMLSMTWHKGAARAAQRWADQCLLLTHDNVTGRWLDTLGSWTLSLATLLLLVYGCSLLQTWHKGAARAERWADQCLLLTHDNVTGHWLDTLGSWTLSLATLLLLVYCCSLLQTWHKGAARAAQRWADQCLLLTHDNVTGRWLDTLGSWTLSLATLLLLVYGCSLLQTWHKGAARAAQRWADQCLLLTHDNVTGRWLDTLGSWTLSLATLLLLVYGCSLLQTWHKGAARAAQRWADQCLLLTHDNVTGRWLDTLGSWTLSLATLLLLVYGCSLLQTWHKGAARAAQRWADQCLLLTHDNVTGRWLDALGSWTLSLATLLLLVYGCSLLQTWHKGAARAAQRWADQCLLLTHDNVTGRWLDTLGSWTLSLATLLLLVYGCSLLQTWHKGAARAAQRWADQCLLLTHDNVTGRWLDTLGSWTLSLATLLLLVYGCSLLQTWHKGAARAAQRWADQCLLLTHDNVTGRWLDTLGSWTLSLATLLLLVYGCSLLQTWHKGAARAAQRWADQCLLLTHDNVTGRWLDTLGSCGQNIFISTHQVPWFFAIKTWFLERHKFRYGSEDNSLVEVGHYTQLVWSATHRVGCGLGECRRASGHKYFSYVCNYCPIGNHLERLGRPYQSGEPCSACPQHCRVSKLCTNSCGAADLWANCGELHRTWPHWLCRSDTRQGRERLKHCRATCTCAGKIK